jgi:AcrR family transcriptional regulator
MRNAAQLQPETRDRILVAAEQVFRTYGYAKTTVADIAKACGMSPANVYRFFASKAAIHEAITAAVLARQEAMAQAIAAEQDSASRRLKKLIVGMHRFTCEQYLNESRVHEIVRKAMDEQWSVIDQHIERMRLLYRQVMEQGAVAGEFDREALPLNCDCVFNAAMPFCHPQLVAEKFSDGRGAEQAAQMADFLVEALRARRPRPP